jgi:hypothetical protein
MLPLTSIYLITPWCRILIEKMIVTQLVKKYPTSLRKPKIHHRVHKNPPWTLSLASRIQFATSIPISPRSILILSSNLLLGHSSVLLPAGFQPKPCKHLLPTHACHMSRPSHPPQFNHPNNIRRRIQFMKLWLCNFLHDPSSSHLGPNIIFKKTFLKSPQPMFLSQSKRSSFSPIQNNWQNYSFVYFNL